MDLGFKGLGFRGLGFRVEGLALHESSKRGFIGDYIGMWGCKGDIWGCISVLGLGIHGFAWTLQMGLCRRSGPLTFHRDPNIKVTYGEFLKSLGGGGEGGLTSVRDELLVFL